MASNINTDINVSLPAETSGPDQGLVTKTTFVTTLEALKQGLVVAKEEIEELQDTPNSDSTWGGITGTLEDQTDLTTALNDKQATLVSGENIKTINGVSLLGSEDIVIGGGSSALPTITTFSTTIPLDGNKYSAPYAIAGPTALTLGATVAGGQYFVRMIANGTNVPTFSNTFFEATGSSGYDNTANVVNVLNVFYDGTNALYGWTQRVGDLGISDTTAPTLTSATVQNATPTTLTLVFSEALDQTKVLSANDFTLSGGKADSNPVYVNATTVSMTVTAFVNGETITLNVASGAVRDLAGNNLSAITARAITNNVGAVTTVPAQVTGLTLGTPTSTAQPLTWTAPSNGGSAIADYLVEYKASSSGTWLIFADGTNTSTSATVTGLTASTAYDYRVSAINAIGTGTASATVSGSTTSASPTVFVDFASIGTATETANGGGGFNYLIAGSTPRINNSNVSLAGDGHFDVTYTNKTALGNVTVASLSTNATGQWNTAGFGGFPQTDDLGGVYNAIAAGSAIACNVAPSRAYVTGDILRIRRVGTAMSLLVSSDGGSTFTLLHNFTVTTAAVLYPLAGNANTSTSTTTLVQPRGVGLA